MLPHANLERVIGAALIDHEFRAALLKSPAEAASGFGLSDEEVGILKSDGAATLEELAAYIYAWINKVSQPRRGSTHRWPVEGYPLTRVAV